MIVHLRMLVAQKITVHMMKVIKKQKKKEIRNKGKSKRRIEERRGGK